MGRTGPGTSSSTRPATSLRRGPPDRLRRGTPLPHCSARAPEAAALSGPDTPTPPRGTDRPRSFSRSPDSAAASRCSGPRAPPRPLPGLPPFSLAPPHVLRRRELPRGLRQGQGRSRRGRGAALTWQVPRRWRRRRRRRRLSSLLFALGGAAGAALGDPHLLELQAVLLVVTLRVMHSNWGGFHHALQTARP